VGVPRLIGAFRRLIASQARHSSCAPRRSEPRAAVYSFARVMAPSEAEETRAAYLAKTPLV
jgi:hypothetical protein